MSHPPIPLPVDDIRPAIRDALKKQSRLIVTAPTGSGKSTRIPGFLVDDDPAGKGRVVCLQPRRLAARMLARRVASERGVALGGPVGYRVRFDHRAGPATRIVFETDGILLQEMLGDPLLSGVQAIVFDEFHERHLFGDVLLGLALQLQKTTRPDLKLVVMSATLDTARLQSFLDPCACITASGRQFPVTIEYLPPGQKPERIPAWDLAVEAVSQSASGNTGHILIFMPGSHEIRRTVDALKHCAAARDRRIVPLYGDLSPDAQDAAVAPDPTPRIIVATNIAETSITIDGVTAVIDSGLVRQAGFDPAHGINSLLVEKISRASADQRAGRAGRTAPGRCLRLWTEADHARRPAQDLPEISRLDLSEVILRLHALDLRDLNAFAWLEAPSPDRLNQTITLLEDLGALHPVPGEGHRLTPLGRRMVEFPLHPRWTRLLLAAETYACVADAALAAALSQERSILLPQQNRDVVERRTTFADPEQESDLLLLCRLWREARRLQYDRDACDRLGINGLACRRVDDLRRQFEDLAERSGLPISTTPAPADRVLRCILAAFPDQVARRVSSGSQAVRLVHGRQGSLERSSNVRRATLLVAPEIRHIELRRGECETRITLASRVDPEWLESLFPDHIHHRRVAVYNAILRRPEVRQLTDYLDLTIAETTSGIPTPDEAAACLAAEVMADRLTLKEWNSRVDQWILRLNQLAEWCPDLVLPAIGEEERRLLVEEICRGATTGREVKERQVLPVLQRWLNAAQQELLRKHAPEQVTLSNGRTFKLVYEAGRAPGFSARIQDLYDVKECPRIARGKIRVRVSILAPNQRPVQVTDDLASFWKTGYEQAKKDLRGRYPKHEWR
ncbi:MAG: ATP-dependent helicase HrpB [Lentisphaerae bacterium RIFOXYC12_FULL_60_16]|nr:MAG: ATP-dependent helicase HrpB [Lentisphaerae bacterium RIFOXYC12_FULL_60_16]